MGRRRLLVTVHRATGLRAADQRREPPSSDPLVEAFIEGHRSDFRETGFKKKTLEPVWDEQLALRLPKKARKEGEPRLVLHVVDRNRFGRNDFLGEALIPAEVWRQREGVVEEEIELTQKTVESERFHAETDEAVSGVLLVSCRWTGGGSGRGAAEPEPEPEPEPQPGTQPAGGGVAGGGVAQPTAEAPPPSPQSPRGARKASPGPAAAAADAQPAAEPEAAVERLPLGACEIFVQYVPLPPPLPARFGSPSLAAWRAASSRGATSPRAI